jgi:mono/diheme cytochrome c family protein
MRYTRYTCRRLPLAMLAGTALGMAVLGAASSNPPDASAGKQILAAQGCVACHAIGGEGGKLGPDLSNEANKGHSAQWLVTQLRNPKALNSSTIMPAYGALTEAQINDLVAYMMTLSTEATSRKAPAAATGPAPSSAPAVSKAKDLTLGAQMWSENCGRCHNFRSPSEFTATQWVVVMHHMRLRVPLTGEQERMILAFLQAGK